MHNKELLSTYNDGDDVTSVLVDSKVSFITLEFKIEFTL